MKIANFDKANMREMRAAMEAKFAELRAEYGVAFKIGMIRFSPNTFRCTLTAAVGEASIAKPVNEVIAVAFKDYAYRYGLEPTDLGREFKSLGKTRICRAHERIRRENRLH